MKLSNRRSRIDWCQLVAQVAGFVGFVAIMFAGMFAADACVAYVNGSAGGSVVRTLATTPLGDPNFWAIVILPIFGPAVVALIALRSGR